MSSFIRHLGRLTLVLALLLSGGTHWLVLQSVAWTAMIVTRARETSLVVAVQQTFDGAHPCALCKKIGEGRAKEKRHDGRVLTAKIQLFHETAQVVLSPPALENWLPAGPTAALGRTPAPALRPPRVG